MAICVISKNILNAVLI